MQFQEKIQVFQSPSMRSLACNMKYFENVVMIKFTMAVVSLELSRCQTACEIWEWNYYQIPYFRISIFFLKIRGGIIIMHGLYLAQ